MSFAVLANIFIMAGLVTVLYRFQKQYMAFTRRVFIALGMGIAFGCFLQLSYGVGSDVTNASLEWFDVVGRGYVNLLRMIIVPLVMVSVISSIIRLKDASSLGRISGWILGLLMVTVSAAALIGIMSALGFGLNAESMTSGAREIARGEMMLSRASEIQSLSIPDMLISLVPFNPFLDMTGARSTSIIGVVIFSAFIGVSALGLNRKKPEIFASIEKAVTVLHALVMRMVTLVLRLTPFGILALMTKVVASSNVADIMQLFQFVAASYVALIAVFIMHLLMVAVVGGSSPIIFLKKILPVLTFAFTSRSSAGTMPLTIQTMTQRLGVSEAVANFSASFGTTIGQNGCAGIYPAMLAVMIAPTVGVDPTSLSFIVTLVVTIAIGFVGGRAMGEVDMETFNANDSFELDMETIT